MRVPSLPTSIVLLLCGCASEPEPGWQARLEQRIGSGMGFGGAAALAAVVDEDPARGDRVVFGVGLETGGETREWRVEVEVSSVEVRRTWDWRSCQAFEDRVLPSEERQRRIDERKAAFRAQHARDGFVDFDAIAPETAIADIRVEAFDAGGTTVGVGKSTAIVSRLRGGLMPACRAGHRQRDTMHGRVAAGLAAPVITVDDDTYDDVRTVAVGVDTCEQFFKILRENPVMRQILREVLALPSLWSILTNWGVRVSFSVDFFAAERVDPARFPGEQRELWSVPLIVLLNGQPGFLARVIVGPSGSPDGAVGGVYGVVARHPTDPERRVHVRLLSSRRGAAAGGD